MTDPKPHPFRPGDWAADSSERIAYVRKVYWDADEALFDLVMYDRDGNKLGRTSPVEGGPRSYEPACGAEGWRRIAEPEFPIEIKQLPIPGKPGRVTWRYHAGPSKPPANYVPRKRKSTASLAALREFEVDSLRKALEAIADGHNDPRTLANEVLGRKKS